jgi:MSHA biogenesis protein MshL
MHWHLPAVQSLAGANVPTQTRKRRRLSPVTAVGIGVVLSACAGTPMRPSDYHLGRANSDSAKVTPRADSDDIPATVGGAVDPPRPRAGPKLETYSVVVSQIEISELLFAMARDAKINVDVHPAVKGKVTLNAINQTLPQILSRLSRQVDLRYEFDGKNLVVMPDSIFVRHYPVDYVNMSRDSRANTSIATQISSAGRDPLAAGGGGSNLVNNNSTTQITNSSSNHFWETLVGNLRALLAEGGKSMAGTATGAGGAAPPGASAAAPAAGSPSGGAAGSAPGGAPAGSTAGATPIPDGNGGSNGSSNGSTREFASIIPSPETGIITVRATTRQHERVREYLDKVMHSARRQVLIEATIAEVQLSEQYQQGVNWSRMRLDGSGLSLQQQPMGTDVLSSGAAPGSGPAGIAFSSVPGATTLPGGANVSGAQTPSLGVLRYLNSTSAFGNIGVAVSLLQSFGKVKVLSSPKISVLNNQTAVLKVVDNKVYFTIGVQITPGTATTAPLVTYTSTPNTVPVGFVMSVTPQIEEAGNVTISVRPTISRIIGYVNDPNPALAQNNVISRIPEIQTRELESILKVGSGDVAVMGGLMQESQDDKQDMVPGASAVPVLGNLFKYRNDNSAKTELVIFLRPIVVHEASLDGDYKHLKSLLPDADFFTKPDAPPVPRAWIRDDAAAPASRDATH